MISLIDWGIWVVYLVIIFFVLWFYRYSKSAEEYRFFLPGFLIKVFGSIAFTLIYVYYYKFGDSFEYYKGALALNEAMSNSWTDYIDLLFSESSTDFMNHLIRYTNSLEYADTPEEWFMVKLISPISFIAFKSYLVINLLMGFISFWGSWKLFKVFADILPDKKTLAFISAFLIPSVVFWGSGIMKDTITLAGVNYIIYALYFGFVKGQTKFIYYVTIPIWFYITFKLKSYITIALLPGVVLTAYYHLKSKINSNFIRIISGPILLITLTSLSFLGLKSLSESSQKYSTSQLEWKVKGIHSWHSDEGTGGSSYNLGQIDYTPIGVVKKIPEALNVTFFRPYPWEARNAIVFLGALESAFILGLFLLTLYQSNFRPLRYINNQSILKGMLIFVLIFGFAIGFTSYNFGALGRYKIPIFSLFTFILFYIRSKAIKKAI